MEKDTQNALDLLERGDYTCAVCRDGTSYTATARGVKPLVTWLDSDIDLRGFCAADRVVGRATAFLYCLLGVREVYARVMSYPAYEVLQQHGISAQPQLLVDGIINRRGTGPCPFEAAVMDNTDADEAHRAIRTKKSAM